MKTNIDYKQDTAKTLTKIVFKKQQLVLGEPKCTETDLKKSQICPIWGQSDTIWMPNLTSLVTPRDSRFGHRLVQNHKHLCL